MQTTNICFWFHSVSFLITLVVVALGQGCLPDWTLYNGNCYKHFNNPNNRVSFTTAQQRCKQYEGRLTDVHDLEELKFLGKLARSPGSFDWSDHPLVGLRKGSNNNLINVFDNSTAHTRWCDRQPSNYLGKEDCISIVPDIAYNGPWPAVPAPAIACMHDLFCDGTNSHPAGFSRFICKANELISIVCDPNAEVVNRKCVCKKDFIDITETDVPEKEKYKPGEKCISKDPCRDVKDMTVNFLVDSSESIEPENWDSLVDFLQSGAEFLPNSTRVGFVKFSNNITFAKFLAAGWGKSEFQRFVPSKFDNGETNTAAAFDKARAMFKKDRNKSQVAVLITDGLPFSGELDEKEILKKTETAAKKLRKTGVSLIALGYGPSLDKKKVRIIQSWLESPEEDYFEYDKKACDLKSVHMCLLMKKVCRRFVKY